MTRRGRVIEQADKTGRAREAIGKRAVDGRRREPAGAAERQVAPRVLHVRQRHRRQRRHAGDGQRCIVGVIRMHQAEIPGGTDWSW
jgi:hypothetical protein